MRNRSNLQYNRQNWLKKNARLVTNSSVDDISDIDGLKKATKKINIISRM